MVDLSSRPEPLESSRFLEALKAEEPEEVPPSERLRRWQERAAVLAWFEPQMIGAPGDVDELMDDEDWTALIVDCEIARTEQDGPRRRLQLAVRRQAIVRLQGREGLKQALAETIDRPSHDPLQRALDRVIEDGSVNIESLAQGELYALHIVSVWLAGAVEGVVDPAAIALRLRREELLQPHRLLAGTGFVGRADELDHLRSYVQELEVSRFWRRAIEGARNIARWAFGRPPLAIFGPGGVGKSTLVAQFILEHAQKGDIVFVDLDFGRPNLDPRRPIVLLAEAARQIATQIPSRLAEGDALAADLDLAATTTGSGSLESVQVTDLEESVNRFCRFAASALPEGRNVPFVLDTFEEVAALGATRVDSIWDLVRRLQGGLPQLRPVICSRVPPEESWGLLNLSLAELETEPAARYLGDRLRSRHKQTLAPELIGNIVSRVTRTPLALNLAAELLDQAVKAGENPAGVVAQLKGKVGEAFLYRRILKQIKDKEVQRLATPGLAVRRLDADVIMKVLAGPCGVEVKDRAAAQDLLERVADQVALVERQGDGSLWHRADVRRLMLSEIEASEGVEVVRAIDKAAAEHYRGDQGLVARTERVYHLLRMGHLAAAEPLLVDEVAQRLRGALDELAPDARLLVQVPLGITPSSEELRAADRIGWERGALIAAQDLLTVGDYPRVLSLLKDAPERREGGPLDRIEAESRIGLRDWQGALAVARRGLAAAQRDGERRSALELALITARIGFATGDLQFAQEALHTADTLVTAADTPEMRLRLLSARTRLARIRGELATVEDTARQALGLLDLPTLGRLAPAVLRDLAGGLAQEQGTLGEASGSILRVALRRLGIEQKTDSLLDSLSGVIAEWIAAGVPGAEDVLRVLSGISGAPPPPNNPSDPKAWRMWLKEIPGATLGQAMASLLKAPSSSPAAPHAARLQSVLAAYMSDVSGAAHRRDLSALKTSA